MIEEAFALDIDNDDVSTIGGLVSAQSYIRVPAKSFCLRYEDYRSGVISAG